MSGIRAFFVGVLAVGGAAMLAVGLMPGDGPEPARASTNHIVNIVTGGGYSPSTITIAPGDTVTFVNTSSTPGNAYAQLGGTDPNFWQTNAFIYAGQSSCAHKIGVTECWTFPNPGTYTYQNNLQSAPKPTGTIIVSSSGGATATPTQSGGGGGGGGGGGSTNHIVNIVTGGGYSPSSITITAGDTVTFVNTSSTPGNAYSQLGGTDPNFFRTDAYVYAGNSSCAKRNTGTECWTFPNAGTFTYHNTLMSAPRPTGTIIVTSGSGGGGGSPTNTPLPTNTPTPTKTPLPTNTPSGGGGGGGSPTNTPTPTKTPLPTNTPGGGGGGGGSPTNTPTPTKTPLPTSTPGGGGGGGGGSPTATPIPTQEAGQSGFGQLGPGWNLKVYYGPDVPVTQAVQGINGTWTVIYHWHGTGYSRYVKPGTAPPWVNSLHIVQNGQVYWIYIQ